MITTKQLRQKYLDFFISKQHQVIAGASLLPENDPTVLFTTAGMHPLVPYLMGEKHPSGNRLVNYQKCIRTGDIDEVGDNTHLTFFEMLGNWSLGDYFKNEAIEYSWEFLTSPKWLGLDKEKLSVSVFVGDADAPKDEESTAKWLALGVSEKKIAYLPKKNNWWGPAGKVGPCGPDTEMFYWVGKGKPPIDSNPGNDETNWVEIWNDVFMQYYKNTEGVYEKAKISNVDTGMGLERTVAVLNGWDNVYKVDTLKPIYDEVMAFVQDKNNTKAVRIITDHTRAAVMIMGDNMGVTPSNVDQGYVVRKLLRSAIRRGRELGIEGSFLINISKKVIQVMQDPYEELRRNSQKIISEVSIEEEKFKKVLLEGERKIEQYIADGKINSEEAFQLYTTYGFPLEEITRLGVAVNIEEFNKKIKQHQDLSRTGGEQKFSGGLADHSDEVKRLHTATHLLQAALRRVLGDHVAQKGSNITAERLRFDFSHPEKMTKEQLQQVEDIVNEQIQKKLRVWWQEMTVAEAKNKGALGLFAHKYGEKVKVCTVGEDNDFFSRELCGGPHAENTSELKHFKILKEEASSAGVRRIKAILN
jgi:alanyl-tRNA synthetase